MLVWMAAISAFLAMLLLTMAVGAQRASPVRARVRTLTGYSRERDEDQRGPSFSERVLLPFIEGLGTTIATKLPAGIAARVRELLLMAGQPFSLTTFTSLTALSGLGTSGLMFAFVVMVSGGIGPAQLVALFAFFLLGLFIPYFWLKKVVGKRQNEVAKNLPNALDLITTSVEAGLGLDAAFAKVAEKVPGPFSEELAQAQRESTMGRSHRDALQDIIRRTGVPEVASFINSVVHAQATGSNIGEVLRTQADQIRMKQRQRIEEEAQKMPIYMTFPLILFLLPSLFIVILGPAAISVLQNLGD